MEDLIDLIVTDASASDVSDKIKDVLFAKSAERIDTIKPNVADSMFASSDEGSVEAEVEPEETTDGE
tara:strand:- start:1747 stop:1947 length:201 start_codon:yes stop_codon:yes gene_type:complete